MSGRGHNNNVLKRKMKEQQGSSAKDFGPASARRRVQFVSDQVHAASPSTSEQEADRCDSSYQNYILSMAQKLALRKQTARVKDNCDNQLSILESTRKIAISSNYENLIANCKLFQRSSTSLDVADELTSILQDYIVSKQQQQALYGLDESVKKQLSLLPCNYVQSAVLAKSSLTETLQDTMLESAAAEMCEHASDTLGALQGILATQCEIQTEHKSMETLPQEAFLLLPHISSSTCI